jgi:hypothetical protein
VVLASSPEFPAHVHRNGGLADRLEGQHVRLKPLDERHQFERREGSLRGNLSM